MNTQNAVESVKILLLFGLLLLCGIEMKEPSPNRALELSDAAMAACADAAGCVPEDLWASRY